MKHCSAGLLLIVMLLSLCGCSHTETVPEPDETSVPAAVVPPESTDPTAPVVPAETTLPSVSMPQKIEITTDNWDDYFEVVYQPDTQTDSFGALEKLYIYCYLVPKAEYAEIIDHKSAITIELSYVAGNQKCKFSEDYSTFELIGEFEYTKDVTHIIEFQNGKADLVARHKVDTDNSMILAYCKDFTATRATGTLILKSK